MVASSITPQNAADTGVNYTTRPRPSAGMPSSTTAKPFCCSSTATPRHPPSRSRAEQEPLRPRIQPDHLSELTVTIPASGTNGGLCVVGPFAQAEYNDSSGLVQLSYSAVTSLSVSAVSVPRV